MKQKSKEKKKLTKKLFFINQGKSHFITLTYPEDAPFYRLKEIFNKNFVGKGESITYNPAIFNEHNATYVVD